MSEHRFPATSFQVSSDGSTFTLKIGAETIVGSAAHLERFVQQLGMVRASMRPEVPPQVPERDFLAIDAPYVAVKTTADHAYAGLFLRTPPYGWIAFNLTREQARDMGRHLTSLATTMVEATGPSPTREG